VATFFNAVGAVANTLAKGAVDEVLDPPVNTESGRLAPLAVEVPASTCLLMAAAAELTMLRGVAPPDAVLEDAVADGAADAEDAAPDRAVREEMSFLSWLRGCGLDGCDWFAPASDPDSVESACATPCPVASAAPTPRNMAHPDT
jgi:hypothetical protein